ncbi:MAG: hypothetical protein ACR2LQ_08155 [Acidimicrobiales bacterium]
MTVAAFVPDLMDRSRLQGVVDTFVGSLAALDDAEADVVVVDLSRSGAVEALPALVARCSRVVAFGSHVDTALLDAARATGAAVLPRSRFFADPADAIASSTT